MSQTLTMAETAHELMHISHAGQVDTQGNPIEDAVVSAIAKFIASNTP